TAVRVDRHVARDGRALRESERGQGQEEGEKQAGGALHGGLLTRSVCTRRGHSEHTRGGDRSLCRRDPSVKVIPLVGAPRRFGHSSGPTGPLWFGGAMSGSDCRYSRRSFLRSGAIFASGLSGLALSPEPAVTQGNTWIVGPQPGYSREIGTLVSMLAFTRVQV